MLATKQPFAEAMSELPFSLWRFSVAQYEAMIDAGILTENDPVELLEGWIVKKMPKNPAHIFSTQVLQDIFGKILPEGWFINLQDPITTEGSEPEPDVAILRGQRRDYVARKAVPDDVALVIEVAEATLPQDRTIKKRVYAAAGIPVYWIINLLTGDGRSLHFASACAWLGARPACPQRPVPLCPTSGRSSKDSGQWPTDPG